MILATEYFWIDCMRVLALFLSLSRSVFYSHCHFIGWLTMYSWDMTCHSVQPVRSHGNDILAYQFLSGSHVQCGRKKKEETRHFHPARHLHSRLSFRWNGYIKRRGMKTKQQIIDEYIKLSLIHWYMLYVVWVCVCDDMNGEKIDDEMMHHWLVINYCSIRIKLAFQM